MKHLDHLRFGAIGAVHEREDADEQGKEWEQREEELVRHGAREERAIVGEEAFEDRARPQRAA